MRAEGLGGLALTLSGGVEVFALHDICRFLKDSKIPCSRYLRKGLMSRRCCSLCACFTSNVCVKECTLCVSACDGIGNSHFHSSCSAITMNCRPSSVSIWMNLLTSNGNGSHGAILPSVYRCGEECVSLFD
jgi:hypothetical protein